MDSNQTLHDFVLNLLTDAEARSAFQLDPEGALNEAGLGDITAADVEDVVPLVVDYTSVQGNADLAPATGDLDLGGIGSDPTSAIGQLQAVTQQLSVGAQPTSVDGSVAAAGAIAVDSSGLGVSADGWVGFGVSAGTSGVTADLSGTQDLSGTLDSEVVDSVATEATGTVGSTAGTADDLVGGGTVDGVLGGNPVDGVLGGNAVNGVLGGNPVDGVLGGNPVDGVLGGNAVDGVLGNAGSAADPLTGQLDGATGLVNDSLDGVDDGVSVPDLGAGGGSSPVDGATGAVDGVLDGVGGIIGDDTGVSGGADTGAGGSTDTNLPGTDILF